MKYSFRYIVSVFLLTSLITSSPIPQSTSLSSSSNTSSSSSSSSWESTSSDPSTSNDFTSLTTTSSCKPYLFLFARGTDESGNMGDSVGPALQVKLESLMPNQFMFQGVTYDATIEGDIEMGAPGGKVATMIIDDCAAKCPDTKMLVSGYSEGAMVVHKGVAGANAASIGKIAGVLLYGDPLNGQTIPGYPESNIKTFCASGDDVCKGFFEITPAHLSYVGADTDAGAEWIQQIASGD